MMMIEVIKVGCSDELWIIYCQVILNVDIVLNVFSTMIICIDICDEIIITVSCAMQTVPIMCSIGCELYFVIIQLHIFSDYDQLKAHYKAYHFVCENDQCMREQHGIVFRSEIDLKAHKVRMLIEYVVVLFR